MQNSAQLVARWAALGLLLAPTLSAADWPHWLGPNGDNIAPVTGKFEADLSKWKVAWKANVGRGYSAVTVVGKHAYTLGHDEKSQETIYCLDAASGKELWKHAYDAQLLPAMHPGGPNATPTVHANRVLTLSKDGQLFCLSTDQGKVMWSTKLTDQGLTLPRWGFASSPVVDGNRILIAAGKVIALDLATGKLLWSSKNEYHPGYTTAVVFERDGRKFIAALDGKGLSVLAGQDGNEITRRPYKATFDMIATTPYALAKGNQLLISGNTSAELLDFDGTKLTPAWTSTELKTSLNNTVLAGDVLYGIDGRQGSGASRLVAMTLTDGKVNWSQANFGYGSLIGVGPTLLALTETGELVSAQASPKGYQELGRQQVLGKTCWTTPVFAQDRIYVRNDRGEVVCLTSS